MLLKKSSIVYDQIENDYTSIGGTSNAKESSSSTQVTQNTETTQTQGDQLDAFGYKVESKPTQEATQNKTPDQNKSTTKETQKSESDIKTGYEAPVEVPKEDTPPPAEKPPVKEEDKNKIVTDFGILPEDDKKSFSEYFDKHNLSKEARDALVEIRKNEILNEQKSKVEYEKQVQLEITKLKSNWYNELKTDKDFGGGNFDTNIKAVNTFISDFLPGVKKMLTDKGGMLPPIVMKDYLSLAKKLNETEKLVQGDPDTSETKQVGKYDFLDNYYKTN